MDPNTASDRPLEECLDDFWHGDFRHGDFTPPDDDSDPPAAPAPDELGPSGITVRGRELSALLAPAYRRFTGAD